MVKLCRSPLEVEDCSLGVVALLQQLHKCFAPVLEPILVFSPGLWPQDGLWFQR